MNKAWDCLEVKFMASDEFVKLTIADCLMVLRIVLRVVYKLQNFQHRTSVHR